MGSPTSWMIYGVKVTLEITVGNIAVAISVLGVVIHFGRKMVNRWDLFMRIAVDYYNRTGNNMALDVVKSYEKIYGPLPKHEKEELKDGK